MDAGALVMLLADAGAVGRATRYRVKGEKLCAPHLVDIDVASALLGRQRAGKLSEKEMDDAWDSFAQLPIQRLEHLPLLPRIRDLYFNLSAYDAAYVALAEGLDVPLITSDSRIDRSGRARCLVEVFNEASVAGS